MIPTKPILTGLTAGLAALMLATAPLSAATPPDVLVVAETIDDIVSMDPQEVFEFAGVDATRNIYEKLVTFDPANLTAGYQPGLAESWTISETWMDPMRFAR